MDIEKRLEKLERDNRRLRRVVAAVVVAFLVFVTVGVSSCGQLSLGDRVHEVLQTHSLEILDTDGEVVADLRSLHGGEPVMRMMGYGSSVVLSASPYDVSIRDTRAQNTQAYSRISAEGLEIHRGSLRGPETNFHAAFLSVWPLGDGVNLRLVEPDGSAILGTTSTVNRRTGAETRHPVSTLTLFDANGNVRVQLPR